MIWLKNDQNSFSTSTPLNFSDLVWNCVPDADITGGLVTLHKYCSPMAGTSFLMLGAHLPTNADETV